MEAEMICEKCKADYTPRGKVKGSERFLSALMSALQRNNVHASYSIKDTLYFGRLGGDSKTNVVQELYDVLEGRRFIWWVYSRRFLRASKRMK